MMRRKELYEDTEQTITERPVSKMFKRRKKHGLFKGQKECQYVWNVVS